MSASQQRRNGAERSTQPMDPPGRQTLHQGVLVEDEEDDFLVHCPTTEWRIPTTVGASHPVSSEPGPTSPHEPSACGSAGPPQAPNHTIELLTLPDDAVEVRTVPSRSSVYETTNGTIELLTLPDDVVEVRRALPDEPPPQAPHDVGGGCESVAHQDAAPSATRSSAASWAPSRRTRFVVEACLVGAFASAAGALLAYVVR